MHSPHRGHRKRCARVALGTGLALALTASPAAAVDFSNACRNSATVNNTQIDVTGMTAKVPASVPPNTAFGMTEIKGTIHFPESVFHTGYNLELVNNGDMITGTAQMVMQGVGTTQGTQTTEQVTLTVGPVVIHDPDGVPHSGDETSEPIAVPFTFPDMAWTSGASDGPIEFREQPVTPLSPTVGGLLLTATIPPSLTVRFGCNPGTVEGENPGTPTYGTAPAFSTSAISTSAPPPPPPTVTPPAPPPAGTYDIPNAFTFGKVKLNRKKGTAVLPVIIPGPGLVELAKSARIVGRSVKAFEKKTVNIRIKARGKKALRALRRKGKLKVKLALSFTPDSGTKLTKNKTVTLRKKRKK